MIDKSGKSEIAVGQNKLLGLEIVRFACAFAVLVWHYQHFYSVVGAPEFVRSAQPLHSALALFYDFGLFGVQLFWGISGFIFFWKYGHPIADSVVGGVKFFWLRFSRLYPLHIVTLLLVAILQPIHVALVGTSFVYQDNDLPNFLLQLGMASHWGPPTHYTFNGPIWSVSAEVFVYAVFFLAMRCFGPTNRMIIGATCASVAGQLAGWDSPALACAGYFFGGACAARIFLKTSSGDQRGSRWVAATVLLAVVIGAWWNGLASDRAALPFVLLVAMPPLLFLAAQDWPLLERWQQPIELAGNLTYSSYLCHFPLQLIVAITVAASGVALPVASPLFLAAYLAVTLGISRLVYERFERPAQAWIRSVRSAREAALRDVARTGVA
jgi:peptidoglycan/LPS O-acetylase OafA/YrhL